MISNKFSILVVTGNQGKLEEYREILNNDKIRLDSSSIDLEEIQSEDIREVAHKKIQQAVSNIPNANEYDCVICDDTALSIESMNNLPGTFIKWFLKALGPKGIFNALPNEQNPASAICLINAYFPKTNSYEQFYGEVEGQVIEPRGKVGFGWDSIFLPDNQQKTFGEMLSEKKNTCSHRSVAIKLFLNYCAELRLVN